MKNGFDPLYPVFFMKVPGYPAKFLCPTMPRVLARDCQCPPITASSSATRSNTIKSATPPTPPAGDHLHYQSATTPTTSYTSQRPPTLPASGQLHHQSVTSYIALQPATPSTQPAGQAIPPVSGHLHYPQPVTPPAENHLHFQLVTTYTTTLWRLPRTPSQRLNFKLRLLGTRSLA